MYDCIPKFFLVKYYFSSCLVEGFIGFAKGNEASVNLLMNRLRLGVEKTV
jgi:hypothetical protein